MDYKHGVKKVVMSFEMEDGTIQVLAIKPDSKGLNFSSRYGCRDIGEGYVESTGEVSLDLSVSGLAVDDSPKRPWTTNVSPEPQPVYFMD
jgi:hypothetical protein